MRGASLTRLSGYATSSGSFIAVHPKQDQFREAYYFATNLAATKKLAWFAACQRLWDQGALLQADERPVPTDDGSTQLGEAAWLIYEQGEAVRQREGAGEAETKEGASDK
ncbi:hypothetical protein K504DRAFT_509038 [Pleomassaria siparia CBS 279.74]|uniref:Uncharacterized protein n=1 Tax=Pleomassaria siparia CBS 279.74 TaxID=1314801 RepID=A0A6G1JQG0_9PLEO|nr:hypothetical protein K504DRAFT_509038 [Pleomassaria siparia CBS 279.74]